MGTSTARAANAANCRSRYFHWCEGIGITGAFLLVGFLAAEVAVRSLSTVEGRWKVSSFLANDDDLQRRWRQMRRDGLLGYAPIPGYSSDGPPAVTFDDVGLRVANQAFTADLRQPVLVVGDGHVMGEGVGDAETLPAHLALRLEREVLNGGVTGYGIDQAVLRGERLARAFVPDVMVLGFTAETVRRAELSVLWGVGKPYFQRVGAGLQLRNAPVPTSIDDLEPLDAVRRLLAHSLLADLALRNSSFRDWWLNGQPAHVERTQQSGVAIACLLMNRLRQFGREQKMAVLVVAQYTADAWRDEATRLTERAVVAKVLGCARIAGLGVLDTMEGFSAAIRRGGVGRYYIGGYLGDIGNRLAADLIADRLQPREISAPSLPAPLAGRANGG